MVFSSVEFIYFFLPLALLGHFLLPKRYKLKNLWLFVTGTVFYAFGEPKYAVLLLLCCIINYLAGLMIEKRRNDPKAKKAVLAVSLILDIGILCVFKYTAFIAEIINGIFGTSLPANIWAGASNALIGTHFSLDKIVLPIGISFFTFQSMSYTVDLYLGNISVQRSFIDFAAYVTCFPQIVAGPIVRYSEIEKSLSDRRVTAKSLSSGVSRFCRGLAKKALLANGIGRLWEEVRASDYSTLPALTAWIGIIAFTFQIYFDFSGYSDMAIGMGRMLGFEFPENFDLPYLSKSVREFWRRWHMTLGEWFKRYVYIPLGGSREGKLKTVRNLAAVWILTGLWHGASFNFLLWGIWFGLLIIAERLFLGRILEKLPGTVSWIYTMLAVIFGWVLFDTENLSAAMGYFGAMFGAGGSFFDRNTLWLVCEFSVTAALCVFFASDAPRNFRRKIDERLEKAGLKFSVFDFIEPIVSLTLLIASTAYIVNESYNPFLYFNF